MSGNLGNTIIPPGSMVLNATEIKILRLLFTKYFEEVNGFGGDPYEVVLSLLPEKEYIKFMEKIKILFSTDD